MDRFASLAMTVSLMTISSPSRRLLPAAGIEPGVNAVLKTCKSFQTLVVRERQQLHQDHAGDVAGRIDPEIGVGEARPGEAAGAAAFRGLGGGAQEAQPPLFHHVRLETDCVRGPSDPRT